MLFNRKNVSVLVIIGSLSGPAAADGLGGLTGNAAAGIGANAAGGLGSQLQADRFGTAR